MPKSIVFQQRMNKAESKQYTGGKSLESSLKAYYKEFRKVCWFFISFKKHQAL